MLKIGAGLALVVGGKVATDVLVVGAAVGGESMAVNVASAVGGAAAGKIAADGVADHAMPPISPAEPARPASTQQPASSADNSTSRQSIEKETTPTDASNPASVEAKHGAPGLSELPRTGSALKADPHHAFPDVVDNFARDAMRFEIPTRTRGGGVVRTSELYQVEGSLNQRTGVFEWIVDKEHITHRRFIPGGRITGFPNQVPAR